jgi:hypothetical protein
MHKIQGCNGVITWAQGASGIKMLSDELERSGFNFTYFGVLLQEINKNFQHSMILASTKLELSRSQQNQDTWTKQRLPSLKPISVKNFSWARLEGPCLPVCALEEVKKHLLSSSFFLRGKVLAIMYGSSLEKGVVDTTKRQVSVDDLIAAQHLHSHARIQGLDMWRNSIAKHVQAETIHWLNEGRAAVATIDFHKKKLVLLQKVTRYVRMVDLRVAQLVRDSIAESCKQWLNLFYVCRGEEGTLLEPGCFDDNAISIVGSLTRKKVILHEIVVDKVRLKNGLGLDVLHRRLRNCFRQIVLKLVRTFPKMLSLELVTLWSDLLGHRTSTDAPPLAMSQDDQDASDQDDARSDDSGEECFGDADADVNVLIYIDFGKSEKYKVTNLLDDAQRPDAEVLPSSVATEDTEIPPSSVATEDAQTVPSLVAMEDAETLSSSILPSDLPLSDDYTTSVQHLLQDWDAKSLAEKMSTTELAVSLRLDFDSQEQEKVLAKFNPFINLLSVDVDEELKMLANETGATIWPAIESRRVIFFPMPTLHFFVKF